MSTIFNGWKCDFKQLCSVFRKTFQEVKKCQDTIRLWHDCNLHEVWPGFQGLPKKSWKFRLNDNLYEGSWYFRNCTDWELTDKLEVNIRSDSNWKEAINLLKPGCKEAASFVLHFVCFYSIDVQSSPYWEKTASLNVRELQKYSSEVRSCLITKAPWYYWNQPSNVTCMVHKEWYNDSQISYYLSYNCPSYSRNH